MLRFKPKPSKKLGKNKTFKPLIQTVRSPQTLKNVSSNPISMNVSVEEYFAHGMQEYFAELELAAQAAAALAAESQIKIPSREPSRGVLGDVLATQLQSLEMVTRAVQTDWKWLKMAVQWRHARTLTPSLPRPISIRSSIHIESDNNMMPSPMTIKKSTSQDISPGTKSRLKRPRGSRHSGHFIHLLHGRVDKAVDTNDLDFDPYDLNMKYTPVVRWSDRFLTLRSSLLMIRWRDRARARRAALVLTQQSKSSEETGNRTAATSDSSYATLGVSHQVVFTTASSEKQQKKDTTSLEKVTEECREENLLQSPTDLSFVNESEPKGKEDGAYDEREKEKEEGDNKHDEDGDGA